MNRIAATLFIFVVAISGCGLPGRSGGDAAFASAERGILLWTQHVSPIADSPPVYGRGVQLADGSRRDLIYVLAGNNGSNCSPDDPVRSAGTYALDAANGHVVWNQTTSGPSRCTTAAPAIDSSHRWIYAPGLDGKVHRYAAGTGQETVDSTWPVRITRMPDVEKVAANLTIGTNHLYVTTSGFIGDAGHYQGHVVTVDLATGHHAIFNSLCSNIHTLLVKDSGQAAYCRYDKSGLFGRGQGVTDPVTHNVFVVSGNGPWNGRTNWGDSILKLDPSGSRLLDSFTPTNQRSLESSDSDLGSTGPAVLPTIVQRGHAYHLLVQGGKGPACDGCSGVALRLLNRDDLSGKGGTGHLGGDLQDVQTPGGCEVLTAPAIWRTPSGRVWVFYANGCGLAAYRIESPAAGSFKLRRMWSISQGGTTPVIRHGVLYVANGGVVSAYSPRTHALIWAAQGMGDVHWQYPLVTRVGLFMSDQNGQIRAYRLPKQAG